MVAVWILILLFNYGMFLVFYPKMILEKEKDCDAHHLPFPVLSSGISLLFLLTFSDTLNVEAGKWLPMSAVCLLVLLLPFLLILHIRRIRVRPLSLLLTVILLAFLSFALFLPVNYITAAGRPVHESVTILEKEKHRGSHTTHYYVTAIWRDERQKMTVPKSLYESVSQGDSVRVCLRKSIFGVEYWQVHN